jgi:hypothetical protein
MGRRSRQCFGMADSTDLSVVAGMSAKRPLHDDDWTGSTLRLGGRPRRLVLLACRSPRGRRAFRGWKPACLI